MELGSVLTLVLDSSNSHWKSCCYTRAPSMLLKPESTGILQYVKRNTPVKYISLLRRHLQTNSPISGDQWREIQEICGKDIKNAPPSLLCKFLGLLLDYTNSTSSPPIHNHPLYIQVLTRAQQTLPHYDLNSATYTLKCLATLKASASADLIPFFQISQTLLRQSTLQTKKDSDAFVANATSLMLSKSSLNLKDPAFDTYFLEQCIPLLPHLSWPNVIHLLTVMPNDAGVARWIKILDLIGEKVEKDQNLVCIEASKILFAVSSNIQDRKLFTDLIKKLKPYLKSDNTCDSLALSSLASNFAKWKYRDPYTTEFLVTSLASYDKTKMTSRILCNVINYFAIVEPQIPSAVGDYLAAWISERQQTGEKGKERREKRGEREEKRGESGEKSVPLSILDAITLIKCIKKNKFDQKSSHQILNWIANTPINFSSNSSGPLKNLACLIHLTAHLPPEIIEEQKVSLSHFLLSLHIKFMNHLISAKPSAMSHVILSLGTLIDGSSFSNLKLGSDPATTKGAMTLNILPYLDYLHLSHSPSLSHMSPLDHVYLFKIISSNEWLGLCNENEKAVTIGKRHVEYFLSKEREGISFSPEQLFTCYQHLFSLLSSLSSSLALKKQAVSLFSKDLMAFVVRETTAIQDPRLASILIHCIQSVTTDKTMRNLAVENTLQDTVVWLMRRGLSDNCLQSFSLRQGAALLSICGLLSVREGRTQQYAHLWLDKKLQHLQSQEGKGKMRREGEEGRRDETNVYCHSTHSFVSSLLKLDSEDPRLFDKLWRIVEEVEKSALERKEVTDSWSETINYIMFLSHLSSLPSPTLPSSSSLSLASKCRDKGIAWLNRSSYQTMELMDKNQILQALSLWYHLLPPDQWLHSASETWATQVTKEHHITTSNTTENTSWSLAMEVLDVLQEIKNKNLLPFSQIQLEAPSGVYLIDIVLQ